MKTVFYSLPIIVAAVLLALFTSGLAGQTYVLSHLFGRSFLPFAAEGIFFILTAGYVLLLLFFKSLIPAQIFKVSLWLLDAALLFALIGLMLN